jgi:hypothetical protein
MYGWFDGRRSLEIDGFVDVWEDGRRGEETRS